jgi:predicted metal-dependent peptidase
MDMKAIETKLARARTQLVLDHPFIGTIALGMNFVLEENLPARACTDGETVWFQPSAIDAWSDDQVKFVAAHECFHPMFQHNFRLNGRNAELWNIAGDYVINYHLVAEGIGRIPPDVLHDEDIYNAGKGTTDGIYNLLLNPPPPPKGGGDPGNDGGNGAPPPPQKMPDGIGNDVKYTKGTPAEQAAKANKMKVRVAQAAQAAKMAGKLSANMERFLGELLNPKVPWETVLADFVERCRADDRTFARPARRFISRGMYLPSVDGEVLDDIVFAIDCSLSITDKILNQFAAEARKVKEDMNPRKLHVIYFESKVIDVQTFEQDDELVLKIPDTGGTAFSPIFRAIDKHQFEPACCVVLTDLCCSDFGPQPNYPVLWVSTLPGDAPWGEIIEM